MKAAVPPSTRVVYAEGAKLVTGPRDFMSPLGLQHDRPLRHSRRRSRRRARPTSCVLAIGEDAFQSGEGRSQADIGLQGPAGGAAQGRLRGQQEGRRRADERAPADARLDAARACPPSLEAWFARLAGRPRDRRRALRRLQPVAASCRWRSRAASASCRSTYAHKNTGRPGPEPGVTWSHYTDVPNDPLYPFGFGLSYTTFTYSEPKRERRRDRPRRPVQVTVDGHEHRASAPASRSRSSTCATWSAA